MRVKLYCNNAHLRVQVSDRHHAYIHIGIWVGCISAINIILPTLQPVRLHWRRRLEIIRPWIVWVMDDGVYNVFTRISLLLHNIQYVVISESRIFTPSPNTWQPPRFVAIMCVHEIFVPRPIANTPPDHASPEPHDNSIYLKYVYLGTYLYNTHKISYYYHTISPRFCSRGRLRFCEGLFA